MERTPRTNASVEVVGAGGVGTGGATEAVVVGADVVAFVFVTGTTADCPRHSLKSICGSSASP